MEPNRNERRKLSVELGSQVSESRLTDEARAGSQEAFERLFRIHFTEATRVAGSFVDSTDEADEVVQVAFVKAWRAIGRFEPGAPFGPWIRTIVANEARSQIRSNARRVGAGQHLAREVDRIEAPEPSAEEIVLEREAREEIDQAIAVLRTDDQRVIRLRYELDLSESEMAARLEVPPGIVKSRLSRALMRLREHLVITILVVVVLGAAAVPQVRAAVGRLLGIAGAEKVISVPKLPDNLDQRPFDWGRPVNPDAVGGLYPFDGDPPSFDGAGPDLRLRSDLARPILTFVYGSDTVSVIGGKGPLVLAKLVPPGTEVRQVRSAVGTGLWLSGTDHALARLDARGFVQGPRTRVDANVLALGGKDGRDYRIQTDRDLGHALDLARTVLPGSP